MNQGQEFPKVDRSRFIPQRSRDSGYAEGFMSEGRPFRIECWFEAGYTYLTFFFPTLGLEDADPQIIRNLLVSERLVAFDDERFRSGGYSGLNVDPTKTTDDSGNEIWSVTIIVGDEDGTYVKEHYPLKRYDFRYKDKPKPEGYFIALCEVNDIGDCEVYFVNDSDEPIEALVEMERHAYKDIPPRGCVKLQSWFYMWEFDWHNEIDIYIRSGGKEYWLAYHIPKYLLGLEKTAEIPIVKRKGWICR